jgi:hypothetical protein
MLSTTEQALLKRLIAFLNEYQMRIREAASLFKIHRNIENPMFWKSRPLVQLKSVKALQLTSFLREIWPRRHSLMSRWSKSKLQRNCLG